MTIFSQLFDKAKFWERFLKRKAKSKAFSLLKERLEARREELASEFEEKHQETLAWLKDRGVNVDEVIQKGTRGAVASVAAGLVLVSSGITPEKQISKLEQTESEGSKIIGEIKPRQVLDKALVEALAKELPGTNRPLTRQEEEKITQKLSAITGIKVAVELDGNRLNTNYGRIGLEQHLPRYPGETIYDHFDSDAARAVYGKSGMTANRGAFGYFAPNKYALNQEAIEKEKYYAVVQTFLSPGWGQKRGLVEWYKHRKVLIVNPTNGKAVVGVIADSGPAKFTGKNFGGSPELMDSIGIYYGNSKTPVLLFFIDESEKSPKLGPL